MRIVRHKSIQHYFLLSAGSAHCFLVCVSHSGRECPSQLRESSCLLRENSTATQNGRFMSKGGENHMPTFISHISNSLHLSLPSLSHCPMITTSYKVTTGFLIISLFLHYHSNGRLDLETKTNKFK